MRNKSNHQAKADGYGYAVDLYPFYDDKIHLNDIASLREIANCVKTAAKSLSIKVEWGGDWQSLKDFPHFELKK